MFVRANHQSKRKHRMKLKPQMTPDDLSLITFSTQIISLHDVLFADYLIQYMFTCWFSGLFPVLKMFEKTNVLNCAPQSDAL